MNYIVNASEILSQLLVIAPPLAFSLTGHALGAILAKYRKVKSYTLQNLLFGNLILCAVFASGFMAFGVLTYNVQAFFSLFTWAICIIAPVGFYLLLPNRLELRERIGFLKKGWRENLVSLIGVCMLSTLLAFLAIVIFSHPIFEEYDSMYLYLPISKSILLGNGLNHDFFTGSDIAIRSPPLVQSINAFLIQSFGYSSVRMFPVYFVFLGAIATYLLTNSLSKKPFLGLLAANIFLIMPALMVVSSRFSLQQDLSFLFFLTSALYLASIIVSKASFSGKIMFMLITVLALMVIDREVGLILSTAIFFGVAAMKFAMGQKLLRMLFVSLAFSPLYALSALDLNSVGPTYTVIFRIVTVSIANVITFFLTTNAKNQRPPSEIIPSLKYLIPLILPLIFITLNFVKFGGPYPIIVFSGDHSHSLSLYREVFNIPDNRSVDLYSSLSNFPRIDVLFLSVALGPAFLFYKIAGFVRLMRNFRQNPQFAMLLVFMLFLLVIWSYTLGSNFKGSDIRHLIYFIPILSVAIVLVMNTSTLMHRVYSLAVIVTVVAYTLLYGLHSSSFNGHFAGFWIDPFKDPFMSMIDLAVALSLVLPLILFKITRRSVLQLAKHSILRNRYLAVSMAFLLVIQIYALSATNVNAESPQTFDSTAYKGWEQNVSEVISYLKSAEGGNVIALRAPAISFFTNRTNFDMYSPQTFSTISNILFENNSSAFENKINALGVKYIVLPNENNPLFASVRILNNTSSFVRMVTSDENFTRIHFQTYDVFKLVSDNSTNLLDKKHEWIRVNSAKVEQNTNNLTISVKTNRLDKTYNRASMVTEFVPTNSPLLMSMTYSSYSIKGNATFVAEIRDSTNSKILWSHSLKNTQNSVQKESFMMPDTVAGRPIEMRLYIITTGIGEHYLTIDRILITHA